jgi:hypothetical protein
MKILGIIRGIVVSLLIIFPILLNHQINEWTIGLREDNVCDNVSVDWQVNNSHW